eukprot:gene8993-6315_t
MRSPKGKLLLNVGKAVSFRCVLSAAPEDGAFHKCRRRFFFLFPAKNNNKWTGSVFCSNWMQLEAVLLILFNCFSVYDVILFLFVRQYFGPFFCDITTKMMTPNFSNNAFKNSFPLAFSLEVVLCYLEPATVACSTICLTMLLIESVIIIIIIIIVVLIINYTGLIINDACI